MTLGDIGIKLFNGHKFGVLDKYHEIQYLSFRNFYQKVKKLVLDCLYNLAVQKRNQIKQTIVVTFIHEII